MALCIDLLVEQQLQLSSDCASELDSLVEVCLLADLDGRLSVMADKAGEGNLCLDARMGVLLFISIFQFANEK